MKINYITSDHMAYTVATELFDFEIHERTGLLTLTTYNDRGSVSSVVANVQSINVIP